MQTETVSSSDDEAVVTNARNGEAGVPGEAGSQGDAREAGPQGEPGAEAEAPLGS